jgi:hypothetical protein
MEDLPLKIPIELEPSPPGDASPAVEYRWDADTEILSAQLNPRLGDDGTTASVEVEGADGSWMILDVSSGRINGVEIAVWPDVHKRNSLQPPASVQDAHVRLTDRKTKKKVSAFEVETPLRVEVDESERVFHFTLGSPRQTRTVRFARDLLLDVDATNHLAGLWMLNVPPFPAQP